MHVVLVYAMELIGCSLRECIVTPHCRVAYYYYNSCKREKNLRVVWYFDPDRKKFESEV